MYINKFGKESIEQALAYKTIGIIFYETKDLK